MKRAKGEASSDAFGPDKLLDVMRHVSLQFEQRFLWQSVHNALHVWPTPIDPEVDDSQSHMQALSVRFASDEIQERVFRSWTSSPEDAVLDGMKQLSKNSLSSATAGRMDQDLFYSRLKGAVTASIRTAVPDSGTAEDCGLAAQLLEAARSPQEKALDNSEVRLNVSMLHMQEAGPVVPRAGLLVRARDNFPGIDGWLYVELADGEREIWLLQNTVGGSYEINQGMREGVDLARVHDWADVPHCTGLCSWYRGCARASTAPRE